VKPEDLSSTQNSLLIEVQLLREQLAQQEAIIAQQTTTIEQLTHSQEALADANVRIADLYVELEDAYEKLAQSEEVKNLNTALTESNQELLAANEELIQALDTIKEQNLLIDKKNQKITDSINYAQRIQRAMLPLLNEIAVEVGRNNFFVLYMPKDIVSGDFYWVHTTPTHQIFVVADCTGHGIPGAFMSMIGNQLLYEIVVQQYENMPNQILRCLHQEVRRVLKQEETNNNDGMECVALVIDKKQNLVSYAGAMNPIYYTKVREDGVHYLHEIKATKAPIGGYKTNEIVEYDLHQIIITTPTVFYLCTDGYQDQFGGVFGKKFMTKRFRELLGSVSHLSMSQQYDQLKTTIEDWKDGYDQTDDITIMGLLLGAG